MLSNRLKQALSERNLSLQECSELADIPLETMKNLYYGKVKDPKVSTLLNITQALDTSVHWIMGETICCEDENLLLMNYRRCGVHGKNYLQQAAKCEALVALEERNSPEKHIIPFLFPDNKVCDGEKFSILEQKTLATVHPDAFMAIYVPNNLWAPRYCTHDIILLKNCFPAHKEEALFIYHGRVYYRKYLEREQQHVLRCVNGRYPDLIFKRMDDRALVCVGTAIGVVRA